MTLELTPEQFHALKWLLVDEAGRMNDDGNDGRFEASPLGAVYAKVYDASEKSRKVSAMIDHLAG